MDRTTRQISTKKIPWLRGWIFQNIFFSPRIPYAIDASRTVPTKEKIIKYLKTVFPKRANGQSIALGEVIVAIAWRGFAEQSDTVAREEV